MKINTNETALEMAGLASKASHFIMEFCDDLPSPSRIEINQYGASLKWYLFSYGIDLDFQKEEAAKIVKGLPGKADKVEGGSLFRFVGNHGGVQWEVIVDREAVCRRVVTTSTVTELEPDPAQVQKIPQIMVTRVVEDISWECEPLLGGSPSEDTVSA